jgi:hypothetical protein
MPFNPEELHKHVKELERIWDWIPEGEPNARVALAKAIVAATASFVEGTLDELIVRRCRMAGKKPNLGSLMKCVKWVRTNHPAPPHDKDVVKIIKLRDLVDHGKRVDRAKRVQGVEFRIEDVVWFRSWACAYLKLVYEGLGEKVPGWLGKSNDGES